MAEIIFGIDHGNGNMKGENVCFPCGLVRYVSEPGRFMNEDILEYQGTYYTLSDTKMPFKADKTVDDDYFILTLYALAMEARNKGITLTGKDVVLGVGLPPADYGQQATSFKKYFLDHAKHGISFKMNGKSVNFYLKDVFVSPQNFAAVMCFKASLLKKYRTVNCIDIGDGTVDLLVIRNGKPDVSMSLNGSLAGLVAVTAGCANVDAIGSFIIGAVAGVLVCVAVYFIEDKLKVDDPVGAVAVHMMNGIWGTIAVGLFATDSTPTYSLADANGDKLLGLFYGGGFKLLGIQLTGMLATAAWTAVTITITFLLIKKIFGLRVSAEEEITGLDATEHGLETAYAGFMTYGDHISSDGTTTVSTPAIPENAVPEDEAVPVQVMSGGTGVASDVKLTKISIICKQNKFEDLKNALNDAGVTGITVTQVLGCGAQKGQTKYYRGVKMDMTLLPKVKVEVVVSKVPVATVVKAAKKALYTGSIGDGKIFVYGVENVIKVRTGEEGYDALQGEN